MLLLMLNTAKTIYCGSGRESRYCPTNGEKKNMNNPISLLAQGQSRLNFAGCITLLRTKKIIVNHFRPGNKVQIYSHVYFFGKRWVHMLIYWGETLRNMSSGSLSQSLWFFQFS